jgi:hypothetical protein
MTQDDGGPTDDHDPLLARQIEAMAGYGVPKESIALVVGIDRAILDRTFPDELRTGAIKANARVAESLLRKATGDGPQSVAAAIFWLKTRAGRKETTIHEHGGADGMPLVIVRQIVDPRNDDAAPLIEARPMDAVSDDD